MKKLHCHNTDEGKKSVSTSKRPQTKDKDTSSLLDQSKHINIFQSEYHIRNKTIHFDNKRHHVQKVTRCIHLFLPFVSYNNNDNKKIIVITNGATPTFRLPTIQHRNMYIPSCILAKLPQDHTPLATAGMIWICLNSVLHRAMRIMKPSPRATTHTHPYVISANSMRFVDSLASQCVGQTSSVHV